jgi:hypothetical protein
MGWRAAVTDFKRAVNAYFVALEARQPNDLEAIQFNHRFGEVYLNKTRPPLP